VVLVPNQYLVQYKNLLPILFALKRNYSVIELADASKYPDFYQKKYMFDDAHLNTDGSRIYSEKLAKQFNELNRH
jgi:hypothetical protein